MNGVGSWAEEAEGEDGVCVFVCFQDQEGGEEGQSRRNGFLSFLGGSVWGDIRDYI